MVGWLIITGLAAVFLTSLYTLLPPSSFLPELLTINESEPRVLLAMLAAVLVPIVYSF